MRKSHVLNLIEAMRTTRQKVAVMLGLLAMGFLFLSVYHFGKTATFSLFSFAGYYVIDGLFILVGWGMREKNVWFIRLFALINALLELMALAGLVWVLYLAQENPGGRYQALSALQFFVPIIFFFLITIPGFIGLMVMLIGALNPRRKLQ